MEKIVQTAGRTALGAFAPEFAHYNDDVLFGENWNNQDIDVKTRSIITVVALMSSGITDSSLKYHLQNAKDHGVTKKEIAAIITHAASMIFPIGKPNEEFAQYFVGKSYLASLSMNQVGIFNVTFEPACRNNWHIHHADKGGGQILICIAGRGYYQEWGKDAVEMHPGDVINIPVGVKHWHGAAPDSWFSHLAVEVPGVNGSNEWLEAVTDKQYLKL